MTLALDDVPHTGAMRYDDAVQRVPAVAISTVGAVRLAESLAKDPALEVVLELDCRTLPDVESANVVAELRGRELPHEIVLLGAHLDAWDVSEGAHDDGAGCVQVMDALRLIAARDVRPRRTVRICLFMNEENGLRGARAYAATHADELRHHVFALESDRGAFAPAGFATDMQGPGFDMLRAHVALFEGTGGDRLVPGRGGADISVLAPAGVPLCEYLPDPKPYFDVHHSANDTLDAVHPRHLQMGAALIAALAWCVADAPEALPRNPVAGR
jgi:hypothetical protein